MVIQTRIYGRPPPLRLESTWMPSWPQSVDRSFFVFFCFGIGTPVYETSDVPGPDEAAADEPGTATSFAVSATARVRTKQPRNTKTSFDAVSRNTMGEGE